MKPFWKKIFQKPNKCSKHASVQEPKAKPHPNELIANILALSKQHKEMSINIEYITDTLEDFKEEFNEKFNEGFSEEFKNELKEELKEDFLGILEKSSSDKDDSAKTELINSLISLMDLIEDFHAFAASSDNSNLLSHAEVLLNSAAKKITSCGVTLIRDENTLPDPKLNTVAAIEKNETIPDRYIIKTLRGGYLYMGRVVRRSQVVVNKIT